MPLPWRLLVNGEGTGRFRRGVIALRQTRRMSRSVIAATVVVTAVVIALTIRLARQSSPDVAVAWGTWVVSVLACYAGLALVAWWVRDRTRS